MGRKRKKSEKELARNREYQKEYYQRKKEELRATKKARYENNSNYRKAAKLRARRRYWFKVRPEHASSDPSLLPDADVEILEPVGTIALTIQDPRDIRSGEIIEMPVYTTAAVADLLGRTRETIGVYLRKGILPEPQYRKGDVEGVVIRGRDVRLFTEDELRAIERARDALLLPSHGTQHFVFTQAVQREFDRLVNGVALQAEDEDDHQDAKGRSDVVYT